MNIMESGEIAEGAPAFYRDSKGKMHFVSREIGGKKRKRVLRERLVVREEYLRKSGVWKLNF